MSEPEDPSLSMISLSKRSGKASNGEIRLRDGSELSATGRSGHRPDGKRPDEDGGGVTRPTSKRGRGELGPGAVDQTVFVIDGDPAVCTAIRRLIESVGMIAETYTTAHAFQDNHDIARSGCLVLEVRLRGMSGFDLMDWLAARGAIIPVVVLTGHADAPMAVRAMKKGAVDFLEKPFNDQTLLDSVFRAFECDVRLRRMRAEQVDISLRTARLTPREREVMALVVRGRTNKQVAAELICSGKTVEVHRARVMEKMQAESLANLVRMAVVLENVSGKHSPPSGKDVIEAGMTPDNVGRHQQNHDVMIDS